MNIVKTEYVRISKKILAVLIITVILFSLFPVSVTAQDVSVRFQIKSIGFDKNVNSYKLLVNISTNKPGHVVYLEEYYTVDSKSNPKYVSAGRFDGGELVKTNSSYNASFETLRPVPHGGKTYTLVKAIVLFENQRVLEYWLTKNKNFIDNTNTGNDDDPLLTDLQNIDIHETREDTLVTGTPVPFVFSSLGVIYEINATGKANRDVTLRVDLLKGRPSNTDRTGGIVYRYFEVSADNIQVGEIAPKYRIENSWMTNMSILETNVGMLSWNGTGKRWEPLPTRKIDKDSRYTYYESTAQGLNSFAITGFPSKSSSTANKTTANNTPTNKTTITGKGTATLSGDPSVTETREPLIKDIPGFGFISAVVTFILIIRHFKKEV